MRIWLLALLFIAATPTIAPLQEMRQNVNEFEGPIYQEYLFTLGQESLQYVGANEREHIVEFLISGRTYEASYQGSINEFTLYIHGNAYPGILKGEDVWIAGAQDIRRRDTKKYEPGTCEGCATDDLCYTVGTRVKLDGVSQYCELDWTLQKQKILGETCENNFECLTNLCASGACVDLQAELAETRGMLNRFFAWVDKLFG